MWIYFAFEMGCQNLTEFLKRWLIEIRFESVLVMQSWYWMAYSN